MMSSSFPSTARNSFEQGVLHLHHPTTTTTREAMEKLHFLLVKEQSAQYQISPTLLRNLYGTDNECSSPLHWRHTICDW
eukprot:scaffold10826_cov136-Skeletonema_menzelii.AAC.1